MRNNTKYYISIAVIAILAYAAGFENAKARCLATIIESTDDGKTILN